MKQENYRLIKLAQEGDKQALEKIVLQNGGLIWNAVRKFNGRGVEAEDLYQIGAIGLIKAVNKFDSEFNVEFSTYAVPMIMGEIRRFLRDDGIIKVSRSLKETAIHAKTVQEKFLRENGRDASISEIASILGCNVSDVALSLEATQPTDSIYKTVHEGDSNNVLLIDTIRNESNNEDSIVTSVSLREAIKSLPVRERQILMLRYYKEKTQSEVARIMGVSQVQISRIEKKLIGVLRKNIS